MPGCQYCGAALDYIGEYRQWYCPSCLQYRQVSQPPPPPPPPPPSRQPHYKEPYPYEHPSPPIRTSLPIVIGIVVVVVIIIISASVVVVFNDKKSDDDNDDSSGGGVYEETARFPTIEIELRHSRTQDRLIFKHLEGDPLDWTKYKIIIENASDPTDMTTLTTLSGEITAGEMSTFSNKTYPAMNSVKFEVGNGYIIEIYNIKENKRVLVKENVICTYDY